MAKKLKRVPAFFYQTAAGEEPVREWLRALNEEDRKVIGDDIATVEFGWPIGMPVCKSLKGGLWEVRSSLPSKREARILFFVSDDRMVLLHGFVKKSQKTPRSDLDLAKRRMKEIEK